MFCQPRDDIVLRAFAYPGARMGDAKPTHVRLLSAASKPKHSSQAALHSALVIFKSQVQHVARLNTYRAKGYTACRDCHRDPKRHPTLAHFRLAAEKR